MHSITVTYKAPPGEAKVTEAFGHTFFDGKPETIDVDDRVLGKLQHNKMFECGEPGEPKGAGGQDPKQFQAEEHENHHASGKKKDR
jgi:hypothetical protein